MHSHTQQYEIYWTHCYVRKILASLVSNFIECCMRGHLQRSNLMSLLHLNALRCRKLIFVSLFPSDLDHRHWAIAFRLLMGPCLKEQEEKFHLKVFWTLDRHIFTFINCFALHICLSMITHYFKNVSFINMDL